MTTPAEIGARIKAARQKRGWSQEALAEAVGVSRSAVAQWETGRAGQLTSHLAKIAETLDLGIEALTHGDTRKTEPQAATGDELAMLRLYRSCSREDQQFLLRTARRFAQESLESPLTLRERVRGRGRT